MFLPLARSWASLGFLSLWIALCACAPFFPEKGFRRIDSDLVFGRLFLSALRAREVHEARFTLEAGQILDAQVKQHRVDVSLVLEGPDRKVLFEIDSPTGWTGSERLFAIATESGVYRLRVEGREEAPSGERYYTLRVETPRSAELEDQTFARAFDAFTEGEKLRRDTKQDEELQRKKSLEAALVHYQSALQLWKSHNAQRATTLLRMASVYRKLENEPAALATYYRALPLTRNIAEIVSIWLNIGAALRQENPQAAIAAYQVALLLAERTPDRVQKASALSGIAPVFQELGESDQARDSFEKAIESWSRIRPHSEALQTFCNFAEHHLILGNVKAADDLLRESQPYNPSDEIPACHDWIRGRVFQKEGSSERAADLFESAAGKALDQKDLAEAAIYLNDLGSVHLLNQEDLEAAEKAFSKALEIAGEKELRQKAYALAGLGGVRQEQGEAEEAFGLLKQSEDLYGHLGDAISQSTVLYRRARAERDLGKLGDARESIDRALELVEASREGLQRLEHRATFLGARTEFYELRVDILLRLHERSPTRGYAAAAFQANDSRQSRSLLEGARELGVRIPKSVLQDLVSKQQPLQREIQRLTNESVRIDTELKNTPHHAHLAAQLARVERKMSERMADWDALGQEIRGLSPGYAALTAPRILTADEARQLLDADTALVAYALGEERSFFWWIDQNGLELRELPGEKYLTDLAKDAMTQISKKPAWTSSSRPEQTDLPDLGKALLVPMEDLLPRVRRLAIVGDGALRSLSFSALTLPGQARPLLETHEVVMLPSASLIPILRERKAGRAAPSKSIALFADPVFDPHEERVKKALGERYDPDFLEPLADTDWDRLKKSAQEAEDILKLFPAEAGRGFVGFDANREAVLSEDFSQYRYVHFAVHGFVDVENPNLSGIQLSRIQEQGLPRSQDGRLRFYEVYNLNIPVDLVTLGACRSATGPQDPGEGPIGVSRSFLYAGATRVVGALWDVDDEASAVLMSRFYEVLQTQKVSPATALREAQRYVRDYRDGRRQKKWESPYYWAGFVLQGDWL